MADPRQLMGKLKGASGRRYRRRLVNAPATGSVADTFWQGSVVSVAACIRGRHRRRAGNYRSRTVASQERHVTGARLAGDAYPPTSSLHRGCGVGRRITGCPPTWS